jgi:putative transposase
LLLQDYSLLKSSLPTILFHLYIISTVSGTPITILKQFVETRNIIKMITYKYRLQPTKSQRTMLMQTLDVCRWLYNETLATRKNAWAQEHRTVSLYDTNKLLTIWKQTHPELNGVFSQVLQNVQERVDLAFRAFCRRVKTGKIPGYPRFRGYGRYDSFTFKQYGFGLQDNRLRLSKIGVIKVILHRPIEGRIKTLTIRRDAVGNWYACFACEVPSKPLPKSELAIGIDVGLDHFATLSNGEKIANPRFFRNNEKALATAQRRLHQAERSTLERAKQRKTMAHIHQRIANQRRNFAHQLSHEWVNHFGIMAFEKLGNKHMRHNHSLTMGISDAAWRQLIAYTTYKAENAGRVVVLVDPRNTSKICSGCGSMFETSLSVRVHSCPVCGLVMERDQNAAINILGLGLQSLGYALEAPAFKRGE